MIDHVSFSGTTFADLPFKFEAGTPDFVDLAAWSAGLDFIDSVGLKAWRTMRCVCCAWPKRDCAT